MPDGVKNTVATDGFKGRLKKRSRRLFHLPCDKRLPEKFLLLMFRAFFFRRPATPESAAIYPLPRGGGLGRGHSPNFGNLPQHSNRPNTSLAACCPLSNSLPRERGWAAVGVKGCSKEKRLCSSLHVGCVRYARTRSPFSLQPQPTACVPCGTHPTTWVQRSSEKTLAAFVPSALR